MRLYKNAIKPIIKISLWLWFWGILFSGLACAEFFFWDFPLPSGSKLKREEIVEVDKEKRKVSFYETGLKEDEIISFYKRELTKRNYNIFLEQKNTAIFMKGDEIRLIVVTPRVEGKTQFILTSAKTGIGMSQQPAICEDIPSVPVYPQAKCSRSIKMSAGKTRTVSYLTRDSVDAALNFYRLRMPQALWKLEQEQDIGKFLPQDVIVRSNLGLDLGLESARQLIFRGIKDTRCMIMIMESPIGRNTLISITYEEK